MSDEQKIFRKMDASIKEKWLKALRSGEYRRARGQLKTEQGAYCCLGVLCEAMQWPYDGDDGEPESQYLAEAGLNEDAMSACVRLNDGTLHEWPYDLRERIGRVKGYQMEKGAPFSAIADFIEKKL